MEGMNAHGMESMSPPMHDDMVNLMHMTFFWGKNSEILFSGWPGAQTGMYVLALILVFILSLLVEWLYHSRFIKDDGLSKNNNTIIVGLVQTFVYTIRVGLSYLVMLSLMSFNGGVFLVAVVGHTFGFFLFGSRVFKKSPPSDQKSSDLPPQSY